MNSSALSSSVLPLIDIQGLRKCFGSNEVLKGVDLQIGRSEVVCIIGKSGSGKSTISKLIARFWDVQQGKITVGGKDIKSMEPESLMSYMSFVFQDVTLFNDTVFNKNLFPRWNEW